MSAPESPAGSGAAAGPRFGALGRLLTRVGGEALERRLARGAFLVFAINILSILLALLAQAILARILGVEGYGVFAYVMGWVNLLVVPALLGFDTVQLRYVASYRATNDWGGMRGLRAFADQVVIGGGTVCCVMSLLAVWLLSDRLDPVLARTFYIGLPMLPLLALLRARAASIRALGAVVAALAPNRLVRPLILLLGVGGLALVLPTLPGPATAMLVALAAAGLALVLVSLSLGRAWPAATRTAAAVLHRRAWLVTAMPLLLFATISEATSSAGLVLLGWLGDTTEAGIYAVGARMAGFVVFPLSLVTFVFAPNIAQLHAKGEHRRLQRATATISWWITAGSLVIALPMLAFAEVLLSLFGEGFVAGALVLRILVIGAIVNAVTGPVGPLMNMTGLERPAALLIAVSATLTIVLNVLLIPWLGMTGAALAGAVAGSFWNLAAVAVVWRRRGILSGVLGVLQR